MNQVEMSSLLAAIGRHWPLDQVVPGSVLQQSSSRVTMLVHAAQGDVVVKAYEAGAELGLVAPTLEEIDRRLGVLDHLAATGFGHAPALLHTRGGARFVQTEGRTIVVMERIAGGPPPDTPPTWAELGRIAARLNADTSFPYPYPIPVDGVIAELTGRAADYPFRDRFLALVAGLGALAYQPVGLIHAELNCANVVREPGGRLVVVDWDEAGTGPRVLESGYPLLTWFVTEDLTFHRDNARAFYHAYNGDMGMSPGDAEMVITAALLHALRYLGAGGNPASRWARIEHALAHRDMLLAVVADP